MTLLDHPKALLEKVSCIIMVQQQCSRNELAKLSSDTSEAGDFDGANWNPLDYEIQQSIDDYALTLFDSTCLFLDGKTSSGFRDLFPDIFLKKCEITKLKKFREICIYLTVYCCLDVLVSKKLYAQLAIYF